MDIKRMTPNQRNQLMMMMDDEEKGNSAGSEFKTRLNETINILPSNVPDRIYIAGASGVGKSTFTAMFIYDYVLKYPERKIFMVTSHFIVGEDGAKTGERAYETLPIAYIPLDTITATGEEHNAPSVLDFQNSLVLFDDCDNLQKKTEQDAINKLQSDLLANGRKYQISVVIIAHQLMNYKQTRNILNECYRVVFFPQTSKYHINRYLKTYAGLTKKDIDRVLSLKSRWVCLQTTSPNIVISEHDVLIL